MINSCQVCSDHHANFGEGSSENMGLYRETKSTQIKKVEKKKYQVKDEGWYYRTDQNRNEPLQWQNVLWDWDK